MSSKGMQMISCWNCTLSSRQSALGVMVVEDPRVPLRKVKHCGALCICCSPWGRVPHHTVWELPFERIGCCGPRSPPITGSDAWIRWTQSEPHDSYRWVDETNINQRILPQNALLRTKGSEMKPACSWLDLVLRPERRICPHLVLSRCFLWQLQTQSCTQVLSFLNNDLDREEN